MAICQMERYPQIVLWLIKGFITLCCVFFKKQGIDLDIFVLIWLKLSSCVPGSIFSYRAYLKVFLLVFAINYSICLNPLCLWWPCISHTVRSYVLSLENAVFEGVSLSLDFYEFPYSLRSPEFYSHISHSGK